MECAAGLCLLANDLGRDDLLAVHVVLDVDLRFAMQCRRDKVSVHRLEARRRVTVGTYVAAGLDVNLLNLARLDITAKRSVYPRQTCMYVSFRHLQGQLRGL